MRRVVVFLLFPLALCVVVSSSAWAAGPVIQHVQLDRGHDTHIDGSVTYHQRVNVTVSDADGEADLASITVTDPDGEVWVTRRGDRRADGDPVWSTQDAFTVTAEMDMDGWWEGHASKPTPGQYTVVAEDAAGNRDTLITPYVPPVTDLAPQLISPSPNGSIVYETIPTFSWTEGVPGAGTHLRLSGPEPYGGEIWCYYAGSDTSVVYNADGGASLPELVPGHTYTWIVDSWSCDDCGATDPRVRIMTAQHEIGRFTVYSPTPLIQDVQIDRGHDTDAPDWTNYHQRVVVTAVDTDGAVDIASVTITDPDGVEHVKTPGCGCWWQEDDYTIGCEWSQWGVLSPPTAGTYTIRVVDGNGGEDSLTTAAAPAVSDVHPALLSPAMDSVIYDDTPTFEWTAGLPGSNNNLHLQEEGTPDEIWVVGLGSGTSVPYDGQLQANHSYFWMVDSWSADDDRVSDPRVSIFTAQHTHGRFTLYGDWPETPPALEGKFAYSAALFSGWSAETIVGYNTDPATRIWLGPSGSTHPDWSPDGSRLLYAGPSWTTICVDPCDGSGPSPIPGIVGDSPRWSPDGRRMTFTGSPTDGRYDVRIANTDGSDERIISHADSRSHTYPDWSPDGQWIVYRYVEDEVGQGIWLVRPDSTSPHPLMATEVIGYPGYSNFDLADPAWSPDGNKLVVGFQALAPGGNPNVYPGDWIFGIGVISRDGGALSPVFVSPPGAVCCAGALLPQWSPDSSKIVFSSGHQLSSYPSWNSDEFESGAELWMVNADGSGDLVRLTYDNSFDFYVSWWAPNTLVGLNKSWTVLDLTVTFEEVTSDGSTTIIASDPPPAPAPDPLTFLEDRIYHISTTAEITGDITIAVDYSDTNYPPVLGERLSLLLWDGAQWIDITSLPVDTANYIIRGQFTPGAERDWFVALALDKPPVPKAKVMFEGCTDGRFAVPGLFVADADFSNIIRVTLPARGTAWRPECVCGCGEVTSALSPDGTRVIMSRLDTGTLNR